MNENRRTKHFHPLWTEDCYDEQRDVYDNHERIHHMQRKQEENTARMVDHLTASMDAQYKAVLKRLGRTKVQVRCHPEPPVPSGRIPESSLEGQKTQSVLPQQKDLLKNKTSAEERMGYTKVQVRYHPEPPVPSGRIPESSLEGQKTQSVLPQQKHLLKNKTSAEKRSRIPVMPVDNWSGEKMILGCRLRSITEKTISVLDRVINEMQSDSLSAQTTPSSERTPQTPAVLKMSPQSPIMRPQPPTVPKFSPQPPADPKKICQPPTVPKFRPQPPADPKKVPQPPTVPKFSPQPPVSPKKICQPPTVPKFRPQPPADPKKVPQPPTVPKFSPQPPVSPKKICQPPTVPKVSPQPPAAPKKIPQPPTVPKFSPQPPLSPKKICQPPTVPKVSPQPPAAPKKIPQPPTVPKFSPQPPLSPKKICQPPTVPKVSPQPPAAPKKIPQPPTVPKFSPQPPLSPKKICQPPTVPKVSPQPPAAPKMIPQPPTGSRLLSRPALTPNMLPQPPTISEGFSSTTDQHLPPTAATVEKLSKRCPKGASGSGKTAANRNIARTEKNNKQDVLQPLDNPAESLEVCTKNLSSDDWSKKIDALKTVRALAQYHPKVLSPKLCQICILVVEEVKNVRSAVSLAAVNTLGHLFIHQRSAIDPMVNWPIQALLLKMARVETDLVAQRVHAALEAAVQNCSPSGVLQALLSTGLSHRSPAVRSTTALALQRLAQRLGAGQIFAAGKTFANSFITAVSKMAVDATAEVRFYAKDILLGLLQHKDFMKVWTKIIPEKDKKQLDTLLQKIREQQCIS